MPRKISRVLILIPVFIIILFILYEILGAAVNSVSTTKQTRQMQQNIEHTLQNTIILDSYSKTGNTSGTGNHVDMLSAVAFQTDDMLETINEKLSNWYKVDEDYCWIRECSKIDKEFQEDPYQYPFYKELNLPEEREHCYVFYLNTSAPFADNIAGH